MKGHIPVGHKIWTEFWAFSSDPLTSAITKCLIWGIPLGIYTMPSSINGYTTEPLVLFLSKYGLRSVGSQALHYRCMPSNGQSRCAVKSIRLNQWFDHFPIDTPFIHYHVFSFTQWILISTIIFHSSIKLVYGIFIVLPFFMSIGHVTSNRLLWFRYLIASAR